MPTDQTEVQNPTPSEIKANNGLDLIINRKTLYHGSGSLGVTMLNPAEETTVGQGVYLTSEEKDAEGYARRRSRRVPGSLPIVYQTEIKDLRLVDLTKDENVRRILIGYRPVVIQALEEADLPWNKEGALQEVLHAIDSGIMRSGNLKKVTWHSGLSFTKHLQSLGYDGLVALEGGEGEDVGNHDSYVIFDPRKVKVIGERKV